MSGDILQPQQDVPEQQQVLNDFSNEELSAEDKAALDELQGELNESRAPVLPEGTAQHVDNQGNVLTPEEYAEQQQKKADGEPNDYGSEGGRRA